jgi:hypothetical protein
MLLPSFNTLRFGRSCAVRLKDGLAMLGDSTSPTSPRALKPKETIFNGSACAYNLSATLNEAGAPIEVVSGFRIVSIGQAPGPLLPGRKPRDWHYLTNPAEVRRYLSMIYGEPWLYRPAPRPRFGAGTPRATVRGLGVLEWSGASPVSGARIYCDLIEIFDGGGQSAPVVRVPGGGADLYFKMGGPAENIWVWKCPPYDVGDALRPRVRAHARRTMTFYG